jgi:hypothetical protein
LDRKLKISQYEIWDGAAVAQVQAKAGEAGQTLGQAVALAKEIFWLNNPSKGYTRPRHEQSGPMIRLISKGTTFLRRVKDQLKLIIEARG